MRRLAFLLALGLAFPTSMRGAETGDHDHVSHAATPTFTVDDFVRQGVTLGSARSGVVDEGIELPAEVRPNADRLAHVAPRFPGIVREVRKNVGDRVRAGDVLAVIESDKLAAFELRAAFAGTVIDKHVVPGEAVARDRPAYIIADLSDVWVNIAVYQEALPEVQVGRTVLVSTPDEALQAEGAVAYIAPIVDQATRTATARVVLPNQDGSWRPGTFAVATVTLDREAQIVVPRRALHTRHGEDVLFVVEGDSFVTRAVTVGRVGRTRAEIVAGLVAGERFADEGSFLVKAEFGKDAESHHDH